MRCRLVVLLVLACSVLLAPLPAPSAVAAQPAGAGWASVKEKDAVLRQGCHRYRYDYAFQPGPQGGTLELRLVSPRGRGLSGAYYDSSTDPTKAHRTWLLCSASLSPGVYKIHLQITQRIDQFTTRTAKGRTEGFRLRRP